MIFGYCRVSSKGQLENNSLEQQEKEILDRYENAVIYKEQFSGSTTNRPIFNEIIEKLQKGDTLVTTKLDRFCRSTKEGLDIIKKLQERDVNIHILNMGLIENSPMGDLIVTCTSMHSRNRRAGYLIGTGKTREEAVEEVGMVVEGIKACHAFYNLKEKLDVEMPITDALYKVLFEGKDAKKMVSELLERDKKAENY